MSCLSAHAYAQRLNRQCLSVHARGHRATCEPSASFAVTAYYSCSRGTHSRPRAIACASRQSVPARPCVIDLRTVRWTFICRSNYSHKPKDPVRCCRSIRSLRRPCAGIRGSHPVPRLAGEKCAREPCIDAVRTLEVNHDITARDWGIGPPSHIRFSDRRWPCESGAGARRQFRRRHSRSVCSQVSCVTAPASSPIRSRT